MQKNLPLAGKTALITGAARRIGAEIAGILHENGMNVVIHYHQSKEAAENLCAQLNKKRAGSAHSLGADLRVANEWSALVQQAHKCYDRLDVLVNNAAGFYATEVASVSEKDWDNLMTVNLKAPFFLAQTAYPFLKKQAGAIVNIIDIHGTRPLKHYPIYSITKAGLKMLTQTLAREFGPDVRVNAVSPGSMLWPEGENALSTQQQQAIMNATVLKKHGNAKEIARAVLFLVKDADYITGQEITIDGGRSIVTA